jgi:hypothetical protein
MHLIRCLIVLVLALVLAPARAEQPTVFEGLQNAFDLNDTNSLVNAGEVNVSPLWKYDSEAGTHGGALKLDWWVTDQQGAFLSFEEYGDRTAYWSIGYQARTVFKGFEVSLGLGTRQNTDDPLGDVKMFITPTLTKQIWAKGDWDLRLMGGCDILNGAKPNPFFGVTFRATKF